MAYKTLTEKQAHQKLLNSVMRSVRIKFDTRDIIEACVEIATVNGRPFSALKYLSLF